MNIKTSVLIVLFLQLTNMTFAIDFESIFLNNPGEYEIKNAIVADIGGTQFPNLLAYLASNGMYGYLKLSLDQYRKIGAESEFGWIPCGRWFNPLGILIKNGDYDIAQQTAKEFPKLLDLVDKPGQKTGKSPLAYAVEADNLQTTEVFLSLGADINTKDVISSFEEYNNMNLLCISKSKSMDSLLRNHNIEEYSEIAMNAICNDSNVNVRSGPGTKYPSVGKIEKNEKVIVTRYPFKHEEIMVNEWKGFWIEIEWKKNKGWCFSSFISIVDNTPVDHNP